MVLFPGNRWIGITDPQPRRYNLITKEFVTDIKVLDAVEGVVEAFVNTMGVVDADGDVIEPTAFDQSIENNLPLPVLWGHDQSRIIGKVIDARAVRMLGDEYKLHATMQFNMEKQDGQDAFSDIQGDYIKRWSVGFNLDPDKVEMERLEGGDTIRRIKELDLVEVSAVIRGSSPDTLTIASKSIDPIVQEETASDTDDPVFDTELAQAELSLIRTQLELKMPKRKKPKY